MFRLWVCIAITLSLCSVTHARPWSAVSGDYVLEAELIGFDDENVVLQRADKEMGILKISELSEADRNYLNSEAAQQIQTANLQASQTWTLQNGQKLTGRVVEFVNDELTIQRRRGRAYVDSRRLSNLPSFYQQLIPEIVAHFDEIDLPDNRAFQNWLLRQRGAQRTFEIKGVLFETDDGDEYAIPFFVFTQADRELLTAGWAEWKAANLDDEDDDDDDIEREHALMLQALAAEHIQNQEIQLRIAKMNLNLSAIRAGLTSAWEVTLYPLPGSPMPPQWVVTLGRNSDDAVFAALQQNPGFSVGAVRRVSR